MRLRWRALDVPYKAGHFTISGSRSTTARTIVIRAEHDGVVGYGEAVPSQRVMRMDEAFVVGRLEHARKKLGDKRVDPDGAPPESPLAGEPGPAACGIDGALLDLWARLGDKPLWQALGLPRADKPTTSTVSLDTPEAMAKEAKAQQGEGFTHLKVKLGEAPERDIARIHAVRDAVPRAVLRVDGNEGWTLDHAVALLPAFAECGVEFIEQPLPRDVSDDTMRKLTSVAADFDVRHVLDEAVHDARDAVRIGDQGLAHGVNLKLQKAGGLRPGLALLDAADERDLSVLVGCFLETWAGIGLAIQLAGRAAWADLDGAWLLADEPVAPEGPPLLAAGAVRAGVAPGLGLLEPAPLFPPAEP